MKTIFLVTLFFLPFVSNGQNIEVVEESNSNIAILNPKDFHCVPKEVRLPDTYKRGILTGKVTRAKKHNVVDIFNALWAKTNELGANSFHLENVEFNSIESITFTISIYSLTEVQVDSVYSLYPQNMIYIIGDLNPEALKFKPVSVKVNNIKTQLPPTKFLAFQNRIGGETTVSKGGIMGAKVWIKGKEDRLPTYISVNGFGVGGSSPAGVMGISFNTGRINPVDINFGEFLVETLEKAN